MTIYFGDGSTMTAGVSLTYAHWFYTSGGTVTISTGSNGTHIPISHVDYQSGITVSTSNNNWTHSTTGKYVLTIRYRQNSGGDVWTCWGITKGGNSDAVGVSARTGSENAHNEAYDIFYTVDSTSATYQVQGWCGSSTKTVKNPDAQGKPAWSNYDTLCGESNSTSGRQMDVIIQKIGS